MSDTPSKSLAALAHTMNPDFLRAIRDPKGDDAKWWRVFLPPSVRKIWYELDDAERVMALVCALELAWPDGGNFNAWVKSGAKDPEWMKPPKKEPPFSSN